MLTLGRTIDNLVLLLCVFQNALGAEHITILHAIELDLLGWMRLTILDLAFGHLAALEGWICRCCHWQTGQHLIVDGEVVRSDLVRRLVIWALDHAVLGELADAFRAEGMSAG